ncbi:TetR/AcrR family transcriptional regulator [Xylophilus sp.]|uniref:TetR/AcrR family transcriptional regulator n=1 Tax=Xylophilus sp. TaxID=2653893 RepID=UPI0013B94A73|nr:TetR/AcrR family transcriptional regulator [Xylophilus sp.]KAF1050088.1 MAG: Biofilm operon icaADBC HTH-type negative transcriptional regulator IcaR [Xylophilus sp.]
MIATTPPPAREGSFKARMHQQREEALVHAASRLLGEKGFDAMTVDDVAYAVGIAKASLYKHFPGKDELCAAAMAHIARRMDAFVRSLDDGRPAIERLWALVRRSLELQLDDAMPLLPSRNSSLREPLAACEDYQSALAAVNQRVLGWIAEAQASGHLAAGWPAEVVLCAIHARSADPMLELLQSTGRYAREEIVERVLVTCFDGLKAR